MGTVPGSTSTTTSGVAPIDSRTALRTSLIMRARSSGSLLRVSQTRTRSSEQVRGIKLPGLRKSG